VVAGACVVATVIGAAALPGQARAASVDYCPGTPTANDWTCGAYWSSAPYNTWWTYTSTTYAGTTLDHIYAGMQDSTNGWFTLYYQGVNAHSVNGCWYRNYSSGGIDAGLSWFVVANGASHTISGHNDDSPNHSNCIPAYSV